VDETPTVTKNHDTNNHDPVSFMYPEGGGVFAIQVRDSDVSRLDPNHQRPTDKYLTDTAIDFIAKHIVTTTANITEFGIRDNVPNTDGFFFFGIRDIVLDI
jgi:hypothetical protein